MRPHANVDAATQYKAQADAVLLSRGKTGCASEHQG